MLHVPALEMQSQMPFLAQVHRTRVSFACSSLLIPARVVSILGANTYGQRTRSLHQCLGWPLTSGDCCRALLQCVLHLHHLKQCFALVQQMGVGLHCILASPAHELAKTISEFLLHMFIAIG